MTTILLLIINGLNKRNNNNRNISKLGTNNKNVIHTFTVLICVDTVCSQCYN